MDRVISFPHLGNYYIVFDYFIRKATKCKVIVPPATTKRTIYGDVTKMRKKLVVSMLLLLYVYLLNIILVIILRH